jgi:pantoate--beta-alanine ligase
MTSHETIAGLRAALRPLRARGPVGLVPTMGALHEGHLSLARAARVENAVVVASIFVNPTQFGAGDDFATYPRDSGRDARVAEEAGVDLLFTPPRDEMYPDGYQTWVDVERLSRGLEGDARPGHFRGVATVCLKLFNIVRPDRAYFGQKDAQQAAVVQRLVRDLDLELELRILPTVREAGGLALSSRNAYLSASQREAALAIHQALLAGEAAYQEGADPAPAARAVLDSERRLTPEYVEAVRLNGRLVLAAAARAGSTRLIDNVVLEEREGK